jgi:hypothetical protein
MEKFREQFKKEKDFTYWAEGCNYGSFNDDYVNWLEKKLALTLTDVVSSKPDRKSLRQIIEERRTNLCLTASILKAGGKNETFFVGKYELLDNILNEFDGIDEPN